jgi:hypothetical protein
MQNLVSILALAAVPFLSSAPASAGDLLVPQAFPTIQAALDAAIDGDRVVVAPGVYAEQLDFLGKAVLLESTNPSDPLVVAATVIDGGNDPQLAGFPQAPGTGLRIVGAIGGAVVRGLTIRDFADENGFPSALEASNNLLVVIDRCRFVDNIGTGGTTGGAYIRGAAQVVDCWFEGNAGDGGFGGGLAIEAGNATVFRCTFTGNRAIGGGGGGIAVIDGSTVVVDGCTFEGNDSTGGGIFVDDGSIVQVFDCTFTDNDSGLGGGAWVRNATLELVDCTFTGNVGNGGSGGAVAATGASTLTIAGCDFTGNSALGASGGALVVRDTSIATVRASDFRSNFTTGGSGGAVSVGNAGQLTLSDCVLFGNIASNGTAAVVRNTGRLVLERSTLAANVGTSAAITVFDSADVTGRSSIVWAHSSTIGLSGLATASFTYSNLQNALPGTGNISADPQFRNLVAGDLRLLKTSPSIDAGDPTDATAIVDAQGDGRVLDGDLDFAIAVDQGADEYAPTRLSVTGSFTPGGALSVDWSAGLGVWVGGYLVYGTVPTTVVLPPLGVLLVDPFVGVLTPWPAAPSSVPVVLPSTLLPGLTLHLQGIGIGTGALTTSNRVSFTLQ